MLNDIIKEAEKLFIVKNGYLTTTELLKNGISTRSIKELEENNKIFKIKRGLYRWIDVNQSFDQMIEVSKIIPSGVFCLYTALSYYDLTTHNPIAFNVAIKRNTRKPVVPENTYIKIYNFSGLFYNTGITKVEIEGNEIQIYDREKTICDCIRLRNKIGFDIAKEAMKEYIRKKDKDIDKLLQYAEILEVKTIIKPFLEVLI